MVLREQEKNSEGVTPIHVQSREAGETEEDAGMNDRASSAVSYKSQEALSQV